MIADDDKELAKICSWEDTHFAQEDFSAKKD